MKRAESPSAWRIRLMRIAAVLVLSTGAVAVGSLGLVACEEEIDLETEEGLKKALEKGEKLEDAMRRLQEVDDVAPYGKELQGLYLKGSAYDDEVLGHLVRLEDPAYEEAYIKAINSGQANQVIKGAAAAGELGLESAAEPLVSAYQGAADRETKRAIFEAATQIDSKKLAELAAKTLTEKTPEDLHISVLRWACRTLEAQAEPSTVPAAIKGMFYVDQGGRTIGPDCTAAVLAVGELAIPEILKLLEGENKEVNRFIKRHQDIMTQQSAKLRAVTLLGKLQAEAGLAPILADLSDAAPLEPPRVLARKPTNDPAWGEWAALIGQLTQEQIFALNDIGVEGNEEAKKVLMAIYKWEEPYPKKYARAVKLANMVEISARVNAARVMAENNMLDTPEVMQEVLNTLKDEDFENDKKLRPAARASIVQDLVTYLGIASKPGWKETVWEFFNQMAANELADDPEADKKRGFKYELEPARRRIAETKSAFELAEKCGAGKDNLPCYAKVLEGGNLKEKDRYQVLKAVYELGEHGSSKHFDLILDNFGELDQALGYLYAYSALAKLGDASKVEAIETKLDELQGKMGKQRFSMAKQTLKPLLGTLGAKESE